jgi:predicted MFS family arabinose efflux permease
MLSKVRGYLQDVKDGARIVLGHAQLRWVALAFVLPQIVHRVFEGLLIPVFAKKVLEEPSFSAYLLTASNLGELLGAAILLKLAARFAGPRVWVKWGAIGLVLSWSLVFTHSLPLLLPLIVLFSMSWASSDLALLSTVQKSVDEKDAARAVSFLYGAFVVGGALVSLLMGRLLDLVPLDLAFMAIAAAFTVLGVAVWYAARRLGGAPPR